MMVSRSQSSSLAAFSPGAIHSLVLFLARSGIDGGNFCMHACEPGVARLLFAADYTHLAERQQVRRITGKYKHGHIEEPVVDDGCNIGNNEKQDVGTQSHVQSALRGVREPHPQGL